MKKRLLLFSTLTPFSFNANCLRSKSNISPHHFTPVANKAVSSDDIALQSLLNDLLKAFQTNSNTNQALKKKLLNHY